MTKVILIGAGGNARVIADTVTALGDQVAGFLDDRDASEFDGIRILGPIADVGHFPECSFIIAIGNNKRREAIDSQYPLRWYTAIHPSAIVSPSAFLGAGTVVMPGAVINAGARIGRHTIVNTASVVEHDNDIGDFCHLSPGAALGGTVRIGKRTHVGIGATVINNINICADCIIGGGAVVVKNIDQPGVYVGVPAKRIK